MAAVAVALIPACLWWAGLFDSKARYEMTDMGLSLTLIHHGNARSIRISNQHGRLIERKLMGEWGPSLRTNLYRVDAAHIAILDFGDVESFEVSSLAARYAKPSADWVYLGAFLEVAGHLRFSPAEATSECMDILMEGPLPDNGRGGIYRDQCPMAD